MELLHEDLQSLNNDFSGMKVFARDNEYVFSHFSLDAQRVPPVADGYILQLRLNISVWRWEIYKKMDGTEAWHRARYGFHPSEASFVADKIPPEMPDLPRKDSDNDNR